MLITHVCITCEYDSWYLCFVLVLMFALCELHQNLPSERFESRIKTETLKS